MTDATVSTIVLKPHPIPFEFYLRRGNRDEVLIGPEDSNSYVDGRSRWFSYVFARPVYLTGIEIQTEGYASYDKFEIEVEHVDGTQHQERVGFQESTVTLRLGKLCNAFRFKPDKKFLSDPRIKKVVATGYSEEEFHEFEFAIREFAKRDSDLRSRELAFKLKEEELVELKAERIDLESSVGKSRAESEQLNKILSSTNEKIQKQQSLLTELQSQQVQLEERGKVLQEDVGKSERKLRELVKELRIFPSEISGFVREGNRSMVWYIVIGTPFLAVLLTVLERLFSNAIDLTQLYKSSDTIDVWTIFLTRIPFVLVAVALVEVCGAVVARLIFEIMRINRQRIEFAKLSIIAKDVSTASAIGLAEMSEAEIFERETKLKMELLREHMKNYVGTEFEYKGSGLIAAIKGVADRLMPKAGG
jgi:hypothetical protein